VSDDVSLRDYFDRIMTERDLRYQQRFDSQEKALEKAMRSSESRLDGMNEFRESLSDAQKTYITRTEAMAVITRNEQDIKAVTDRINISAGRGAGMKDGYGWLIGIIAIAISLLAVLWRR
jgi:hypothetical protein